MKDAKISPREACNWNVRGGRAASEKRIRGQGIGFYQIFPMNGAREYHLPNKWHIITCLVVLEATTAEGARQCSMHPL